MNSLTFLTTLPALLASPDGGGSAGAPPWIMILVGLAIGIGVGMVIVARAKRRHPVQGPGRKPGQVGQPGQHGERGRRGGNGREKSDRG
jgi:hypothetical protein